MATYKITRMFQHTEDIEVEAENEQDALSQANDIMEWDLNHDDMLVDEKAEEVE